MFDYDLPAPSPRARELQDRMVTFMRERVLPAEAEYQAHRRAAGPYGHVVPPVVEELKKQAQAHGLWNLFLPAESGLTQLEYAPIAELSGWSLDLAPEAINGQAPDTGNMELLHLLGSEEQKREWLEPLLAGEIRSAFAMTPCSATTTSMATPRSCSPASACRPRSDPAAWGRHPTVPLGPLRPTPRSGISGLTQTRGPYTRGHR